MTHPVFAKIDHDALLRVQLDSLEAVYHRRSGMTHLLVDPAPALLDILQTGDADMAQIMTSLASDYEMISDESEAAPDTIVAARLAELYELGLISRKLSN